MKKIILTLMVLAVTFTITAQTTFIPKGSIINPDGECSVVVPPAGWTYIALQSDNTHFEGTANITICCDCTSGSGTCTPIARGNDMGCLSSYGCRTCNSSVRTKPIDKNTDLYVLNGGYVNYGLGISFKKDKEVLPAIFPQMEKSDFVQKAIQDFLFKTYKGAKVPAAVVKDGIVTAPTGYKLAAVNVFGRGGFIVVPQNTDLPLEATAASGRCTCSAGTCSFFSMLSVSGCKGECTGSCCLSLQKDGSSTTIFYSY